MADTPRPVMLVSGGTPTEPLWESLGETHDLAFLYAQAAQQAQARGLPAAALSSLTNPDVTERAGNAAALFTARVVNDLGGVRARLEDAYGPERPKLLDADLDQWFAGYAMHLFSGQVMLLEQLETLRALGRTISGCIVHEDVAPDTRGLVNWANAHGIPTIHIPHAPCHLRPGVNDIHRQTRAKWIAAGGALVRDFYTECGHDPAAIRVTGAPQWDSLYADHPARGEAQAVLGIQHDGPVLAYQATWGQTTSLRSGFEAEFEQGWRAVLDAARSLGAYVIVKIHWHDQRAGQDDAYVRELEAAGVPGLATRDHFHYVLRAADLVIAQGPSNVCLDAAILGTPSVYIQTDGFDFRTPLPYRARPDGIEAAIRAALENKLNGWDETVTAYNAVHAQGGGATENVLAWIAELIQ